MLFTALSLLCGCAGVGILATDDPYTKLKQADRLMDHDGRVMRARQLTEQAIAIFEQRQDKAGLAQAYRQYGLVAEAGGLGSNPVILFDPRAPLKPSPESLDLSSKYLKMAQALAEETKQTGLAANIIYIEGMVEVLRGTPLKACPYYDLALTRYQEAAQTVPARFQQGPPPAVFLAQAKKQARCP